MNEVAAPTTWGRIIRLSHWLTLVLIVLAWWSMETRDELPKGDPDKALWMGRHMTFGIAIWLLTVFRLGWRQFQVAPPLVNTPQWQIRAARGVQALLYAVLILMPLAGIAARTLEGHEVSFAGIWVMPQWFAEHKALSHWFEEFHAEFLWPALLTLAGVHAAAAIYHQFYLRDNLLMSMVWKKTKAD